MHRWVPVSPAMSDGGLTGELQPDSVGQNNFDLLLSNYQVSYLQRAGGFGALFPFRMSSDCHFVKIPHTFVSSYTWGVISERFRFPFLLSFVTFVRPSKDSGGRAAHFWPPFFAPWRSRSVNWIEGAINHYLQSLHTYILRMISYFGPTKSVLLVISLLLHVLHVVHDISRTYHSGLFVSLCHQI